MKEQRNRNEKQRLPPFSLRLWDRYVGLALWFLDPSEPLQYKRLAVRIRTLWTTNGVKFLVLYLKECVRLILHSLSGKPTTCDMNNPGGPRVGSRRGLPLLLPGPLRLLIEAGDQKSIRTTLTILSVYRIIKYKGQVKLSTITDGFKGISTTFMPAEVATVWTKFTPYLKKLRVSDTPLLLLRTAGPNYKISILGASLDAVSWRKERYLETPLWKAFEILAKQCSPDTLDLLRAECDLVRLWSPRKQTKLGKLSLKDEPAGKVRVFAIADVWTQSVLAPLHDLIFSILKGISQDGTFDQARPMRHLVDRLAKRSDQFVASFDLSVATDRLPIDFQVQVLSQLVNRELAEAWKELLVGRDWFLKGEGYRYSVGQPMGALSSWGMLALSHHFVIQLAASRVGLKDWFEDYAIIGDDVVIANRAVAASYHATMTEFLGVDINLSKSLESDVGVMEFAKRIVSPMGEFTPIGPGNLHGVLRHPSLIPSLFLDFIGKGGVIDWTGAEAKILQLAHRTDLVKISKGGLQGLIWSIIGPFGFITAPGLTSIKMANSLELFDTYEILEAINLTLEEYDSKEQDLALEKTMKTVNSMVKVIREGEHRGIADFSTPPSFQYAVSAAKARLNDLALGYVQEPVDYSMDPTGLTVGEVVTAKLLMRPKVSPLDNCLTRPEIQRPRMRKLSLDFFARVHKYAKALSVY